LSTGIFGKILIVIDAAIEQFDLLGVIIIRSCAS
jgi:hypothetical protein